MKANLSKLKEYSMTKPTSLMFQQLCPITEKLLWTPQAEMQKTFLQQQSPPARTFFLVAEVRQALRQH